MVRAQTVYAVGGYSIPSFASPDPIGSTTPNSGQFTTLSASGAITGGSTITGKAGTGTGAPVMVGTLNVNTTQVGNVGGGTDTLMSYTLPANSLSANGKGVRVTMWGTFANNANSKLVSATFGTTGNFGVLVLPTSMNGVWRIEGVVIRTGANTQITSGRIQASDLSSTTGAGTISGIGATSPTETDSSTITISGTAVGVADNDIVQKGMIVEFIS